MPKIDAPAINNISGVEPLSLYEDSEKSVAVTVMPTMRHVSAIMNKKSRAVILPGTIPSNVLGATARTATKKDNAAINNTSNGEPLILNNRPTKVWSVIAAIVTNIVLPIFFIRFSLYILFIISYSETNLAFKGINNVINVFTDDFDNVETRGLSDKSF